MTTSERPAIINDRYELVKRIGRGGMAEVFLGNDRLLDRQVAIKMLFPEFAVDPNFVERFRREAQAAANLNHPNIVNVFDWGKHASTYFIAMEYVDGRTLADILRTNGHLTSKQAAEIASEVAAALGFAHAAGLVHRDIKPANILIGTNGSVKVADFGIARALNAPTESNLTQAGAVMGTATYFSPEQAQGAQPDPRSDLYSLGVVMYEMIAGRPPFTGDNPVGIAYRQVHDYPTPLNQLVADVPRPFEAIVAKLLSKDPAVRYSTADALREDLRRFRMGERPVALQSAAVARARDRTDDGGDARPRHRPAGPGAHRRAATRAAGAAWRRPTPGPAPQGSRSRRATASSPAPAGTPSPPSSPSSPSASAVSCCSTRWRATIPRRTGSCPTTSASELSAVVEDLTRRDLTYTVVEQQNDQFQDGVVHRTDPGAGTVMPEGGRVQLFVNPTNDTAVVPEVAGMTLDEARRTLEGAGFRVVEPVTEESDEVDAGRVIRTDPAEGEEVGVQDPITVFVAGAGAAPTTEAGVAVPFVIGASEAGARQAITGAGLEVDVVYIDRPFGDQYDDEVMDQSPRVPARLQEGEVVTINVGRAGEPPSPTNPQPTNPQPTNPQPTNPQPTNPPQTNPPPTNPPPTTQAPTTTQSATTTTGP